MYFQCVFLILNLITYHSDVGVQIIDILDLGMSTLPNRHYDNVYVFVFSPNVHSNIYTLGG